MSSSHTNLQVHIISGTKSRTPWITPEIQPHLYAYLCGVVKGHNAILYEIGGMPDHIHLLIRYRPDLALSDLVRELKSESTTWMKKTYWTGVDCGWQRGYGAFSVSHSQSENVRSYIRGQAKHHAKRDFKAELEALLKLHDVEYKDAYIWD